MNPKSAGQKTYQHLLKLKRMPTEYEVVTTDLHYYWLKGLEVDVPLVKWYQKYQSGSPFKCSRWEDFADPRQTTYTSYTALQSQREIALDAIVELMDKTEYRQRLSAPWLSVLNRLLAPLLYPLHGFQMIAAYIAHMAPASRITVVGLLQAADEVKRIQRLAYRIRQLQHLDSTFGDTGKQIWQTDPIWQPLRQAVEKLLIAYDWGESLVGLNLALKPVMDDLFTIGLGQLARQFDDPLLEQMLELFRDDWSWHRQWTVCLIQLVAADCPSAKLAVSEWLEKWTHQSSEALSSLATGFVLAGGLNDSGLIVKPVMAAHQDFVGSIGL